MIILKYNEWKETLDTLGMYIQMAGKVMLARKPAEPEWEHVAMKITPRSITTGPIPTDTGLFQIEFDFVEHDVIFSSDNGRLERIPLKDDISVADFYTQFKETLAKMSGETKIYPVPQEWNFTTRFDENRNNKTYDPTDAERAFEMLKYAHTILNKFAAPFRGRRSGINFWWGTFDMGTTRFSGKQLPLNPQLPAGFRFGVDAELVEFGFNVGNGLIDEPYFYVFFYPLPEGIDTLQLPEGVSFIEKGGQLILPLEKINELENSEKVVLDFFQMGYEAATRLQKWENLDIINRPLEYPTKK